MSNENERGRNKQKKKKISVFRVCLLIFLVLSIVVVSAATGIIFGVIKNTKPIDPNNIESMLDESSFIYDQEGKLVEKIHGGNFRSVVNLDKIPMDLQNAVVSIEDERFYKHPGIDIKRIFGAVFYDIKTMSKAQGASTITQQLAKNIYTSPEKTLSRKIKDAYYAIQLEKYLSKDEILRAYLNTMFLGRGAIGVQAASQTYFSKDVSELNLAECAMLAGITKYPSKYSPYITAKLDGSENLNDLKDKLILYPKTAGSEPSNETEKAMFKKLLSKGYIDNYQYEDLMQDELILRKAVENPDAKVRQGIVLSKMLELGKINQNQYDEAKSTVLDIKIPKKVNGDISSYFGDLIKDEVIDALVKKGYSEDEARDILYNGGLRIYSTMDINLQKILEKEYQNNSNFPGSFRDKQGNIQPQSAMVIMDYHTGQVKALIGGRMIGGAAIYNRAINPRQPGSSIKPLAVYLPALNLGMSAATPIDDSPNFKIGDWQPKNYGNSYKGNITLRDAVQYSSNIGAVKTAQGLSSSESASINVMMDYLKNEGITTVVKTPGHNDKNFPALALGGMTKGITPLEMTAAYASIANKGVYTKPILFTKIETADGKLLLDNTPIKHKVVDPEVAYVMTDILKSVVTSGTGGGARIGGFPVAGKTGTTSDNRDAWFCGFTPYYVGATWIGNDMNQSLPKGSTLAAHLWGKVMAKAHDKLPSKSFDKPSGIIEKSICTHSGELATNFCPSTRLEVFVSGTEPTTYCKIHTHTTTEEENPTESPDTINNTIDKWLDNESSPDSDSNSNSTDNENQNNNSTDTTKEKPQTIQVKPNSSTNTQNPNKGNIQIIDSN